MQPNIPPFFHCKVATILQTIQQNLTFSTKFSLQKTQKYSIIPTLWQRCIENTDLQVLMI